MKHNKFEYVKKVVEAGLNVLLTGPAGTGKTTIAMQVAEDTGRPFSSLSLTKQTSVNAIIGFISINGTYIPSQFRTAYEEGHLFLLDELDAADPNVLLILNTLENGYIAFPDGIIHGHKNFRLVATANPQEAHSIYTGRSKLDFSTLDRYYTIELPRDPELEKTLTSEEIVITVDNARTILKSQGSSIQVTMRDSIRIHQLTTLGLDENPIEQVVFHSDKNLLDVYKAKVEEVNKKREDERKAAVAKAEEEAKTQNDTTTLNGLWAKVEQNK